MYCGMAFDVKEISPLCSIDANDSLLVWSENCINELKKKNGKLERMQVDAVSYLWEICYDILIAPGDNVSESPGFEALGLRTNSRKRRQ